MFAIFEAIIVEGAYPSYCCCSIEYFASGLDPILKFGLESVRFSETAYLVVVTVRTVLDSFR